MRRLNAARVPAGASDAYSFAVAQTCPRPGDVEANVREHLRLAELAAAEGARLVLFPELSLTGYELGLADDLAFTVDDPRLAGLAEAAAGLGATLVVGAPVRIGLRLCIGAVILAADGGVQLYTKHHLGAFSDAARRDGIVPPPESSVFHPGDLNPIIPLGGRSAAVAVCADFGRPAHAARAAERGADVYLASAFVIPSDFDADATRLGDYARRHGIAVALANFGSATGGLAAAGRSSIWSSDGDLVARLEARGRGVAVARADRAAWNAKAIMLGEA